MAEIQPLPKNWQRQVENHLHALKVIRDEAAALSNGEEKQRLTQTYKNMCFVFTGYLKTYFDSPQKFGEILHADIEKKLLANGLSASVAGDKSHWEIPVATPVLMAERAGKVYEENYKKTIEGLSHFKALHHAAPVRNYTL